MSRALLLPALLLVLAGCYPTKNAIPPDVAPAEDAPTLRTTPTPPGRTGDVPGPPVIAFCRLREL